MIRSFKLALGITTCLGSITSLEAKSNLVNEELKKQRPHVIRAAAKAKLKHKALLNNRNNKKARAVTKSKKALAVATVQLNQSALTRALRSKFPFAPIIVGYNLSKAKQLINNRKVKFTKTKTQVVKAKQHAAIKAKPVRAAVKAQLVRALQANDNENTGAVKLVVQPLDLSVVPANPIIKAEAQIVADNLNIAPALNNSPQIPLSGPIDEIAQVAAEEPKAEALPNSSPQISSNTAVNPVLSEPEKSTSTATSLLKSKTKEPVDIEKLRGLAISNMDRLRTGLSGMDLDTLNINEDGSKALSLTQLTPRINKILSNDNSPMDKSLPMPRAIDSLKRLKELLTNGNVDFNAMADRQLEELKAYGTTVSSHLKSYGSEPGLISTVQGKFGEARNLLSTFTPGVSIATADPKDVRAVKQSLWEIRRSLTNDSSEVKGDAVTGTFMSQLVAEAKEAMDAPKAGFGDSYFDLVRAKHHLTTMLDKLKIEQPSIKAGAIETSKAAQVEATQHSEPLLPVLERAKPIFSRLNELLADPNFKASAENESSMNLIIGQLKNIKQVSNNTDPNDPDRTSVLRELMGNVFILGDTNGNDTMSLGIAYVHAKTLLMRLEAGNAQPGNAQLVIKLNSPEAQGDKKSATGTGN